MSSPEKIHISELLNESQLEADMVAGYIKRSKHPTLPISILCYTHIVQFQQYWTRETMVCRGLIVDNEGYVIARGPEKFFNYGQKGAPEFSLDTTCIVTDKVDGSLGIYWRYGDEDGIATKGSFISPQAIKATEMLHSSEIGEEMREQWPEDMRRWATPIFEIIYPDGRIVLDYGQEESLRRLGNVHLESGKIRRQILSDIILHRNITIREALALPPRNNAEGLVLDVVTTTGFDHIKIKQEDYKRLHAIISHTSERSLWVYLVAEKFKDDIENPKHWGSIFFWDVEAFEDAKKLENWRDTLFDAVPDEFEEWVHKTLAHLEEEASILADIAFDFARSISHLQGKELFEAAKVHPYGTEIIRYIRNQNAIGIHMKAWADIQPRGVSLPPFAEIG